MNGVALHDSVPNVRTRASGLDARANRPVCATDTCSEVIWGGGVGDVDVLLTFPSNDFAHFASDWLS